MSEALPILVVEDDLDTQANLRDILELDGFEVDVAGSVAEALGPRDWSSLLFWTGVCPTEALTTSCQRFANAHHELL